MLIFDIQVINLQYLVQAWELYLLLIPRFRPSHCLSSRISNAEAHADMYVMKYLLYVTMV